MKPDETGCVITVYHVGKVPIALVLVTKKYVNNNSAIIFILIGQDVGFFFNLWFCPLFSLLFMIH